MEFVQQSQRFSAARRSLMLPHGDGEAAAIASAMNACALGLRNLRRGLLDEHASRWLLELEALLGTSAELASANPDRARWLTRAAELDSTAQADFSRLVDELAHWFERKSR